MASPSWINMSPCCDSDHPGQPKCPEGRKCLALKKKMCPKNHEYPHCVHGDNCLYKLPTCNDKCTESHPSYDSRTKSQTESYPSYDPRTESHSSYDPRTNRRGSGSSRGSPPYSDSSRRSTVVLIHPAALHPAALIHPAALHPAALVHPVGRLMMNHGTNSSFLGMPSFLTQEWFPSRVPNRTTYF